jgi:C-terminal processing protease CtpA/Prc
MPRFLSALLIISGLALVGLAGPSSASAQVTDTQLREDLATWQTWLGDTHPDLAHSTDMDALATAIANIGNTNVGDLTRREAWLALSALNPLYQDAHTGLVVPRDDTARPFPPLTVNGETIRIANTISGDSIFSAGQVITAINDEPVSDIINGLLPHIRGESPRLRAYILQLKFADYLQLWQGPRDIDYLQVETDGRRRHTIEVDTARDIADSSAQRPFNLHIEGDAATLILNSFDRALEEDFNTFLPDAFAQIANSGATNLNIDIRHNGGGARQLSDALLGYLTDQRYTPISAVKARIVSANQAMVPGSQLGQVMDLPFAQWVEPPANMENRFAGEVSVEIGPATYSQAIVFATIVQDFAIGTITGTPTEGPANQTGQTQSLTLPHTGFEVRAPIYIFTRASGDAGRAGVMPDE